MDLETSGGIFDEDVATQFMIGQSLLEGHKQSEFEVSKNIPVSPEREKIFNAIKHGKYVITDEASHLINAVFKERTEDDPKM